MKRILVIGGCGAGKSTFAKRLAPLVGLPLVHLDCLGWQGEWEAVPRDEFDRRLTEVLGTPAWIIDGNYSRTIPLRLTYADTVFWFDFPGILYLKGVLERFFRNYGRSRDDMGGSCPERLDREKLKFFHFALWFNRKNRPRIRAALQNAPHAELIVFRNRRQAENYLRSLEKETADGLG